MCSFGDNPEESPILLAAPRPGIFSLFIKLIFGLIFIGFGLVAYAYYLNQPAAQEGTKTVLIDEGQSVPEIINSLKEAGVVRSDTFLYLVLVSSFDPTAIKASRYIFTHPLSTYEVAELLMHGDFDSDLLSVTVFEGESRKKIADRLEGHFNWFDRDEFLTLTEGMEGELFPDTYFIPGNYTTEQFIELLRSAHDEVLRNYDNDIEQNNLTQNQIVILASIVEREANSSESMKLVAGIFLNRLHIGMALQADATIEYVLEEGINELPLGGLAESLKEIDSPYNTYKYPGLPPTPISNPGQDAIEAVLYSTSSEYLYYITGNDGEFYYAKSYQEHLNNINQYLR